MAQKYGSSTAIRALWRWAGGLEEEIVFKGSAAETCAELWNKAAQGGPVSQVSIVREMLYDEPGNVDLLGFLLATANEKYPDVQKAVPEFKDVLGIVLEADAYKAVWPALTLFPTTDWEAVFAALAPAVEGVIPFDHRELLAAECILIGDRAKGLLAALWATKPELD